MSNSMYRRSIGYRNAAALLLAVTVGLAGVKTYYSWQKTDLYAKAVQEQANGQELKAEELFRKARANTMIEYKNNEIDAALNALGPVTDLKRQLQSIVEDVQAASQVNDVSSLLSSYETFHKLKKQYAAMDEAAQKRFAEAETAYQAEEQLNGAFANVKTALLGNLEAATAKKTSLADNTVAFLVRIPAVYFKDERTKKQELSNRLKAYDQARMDSVFKKQPFAEVIQEAAASRKFYAENGIQADWLVTMVEAYAQNTLAALLKNNDLKGFIANAKTYQAVKDWADSRSKVNVYIQSTINAQYARAEQLATAKKYEEAIELYGVLAAYKDTSKEIAAVEQRRLEGDPLQLLRKAMGGDGVKLANVVSAKALWGAKQAAVGIADNKTLVVARLMPDQKVNALEARLDGSLTVKSVKVAEKLGGQDQPALLVEAASKARKARFIVFGYDAKSGELRELLDVEADTLAQDKARPGTAIVDNPAGGTAGSGDKDKEDKAVFEYKNGKYERTNAKPAGDKAADIALADLPKQKTGTVVRFQATIKSVDGNTAVIALGNDEIVQLSGSFKFKTGPAVITGTYAEKGKITANNQTVAVHKINVTEWTPGEASPAPTGDVKNRKPQP